MELTTAAGRDPGWTTHRSAGLQRLVAGLDSAVTAGRRARRTAINYLDQRTDLHAHGLRVSPQANWGNPFVRVEPVPRSPTSIGFLLITLLAPTRWCHPTATARWPTSSSEVWPGSC